MIIYLQGIRMLGTVFSILFAMLPTGSVFAQEGNGDFTEFIRQLCSDLDPVPSELVVTCRIVNPSIDPDSFVLLSTGNLNGFGAQEQSAVNNVLYSKETESMPEETRNRSESSADFTLGKMGGFFSILHGEIDRKNSTMETGYNIEVRGAMLGLNFGLSDKVKLKGVFSYTDSDTTFDNNEGALTTGSSSIVLLANYSPSPNFYTKLYAGYTALDFKNKRNAAVIGFLGSTSGGTAVGQPNGSQRIMGISAGYRKNYNYASIGTFVQVDSISTKVESYTEIGDADLAASGLAMSFNEQEPKSLTSSIGIQGAFSISSLRPVVPEIRVSYIHEHQNDSRQITGTLNSADDTTFVIPIDSSDRNYFSVSAGASVNIRDELSTFLFYRSQVGHTTVRAWSANAGIRFRY